MVSSDINTFTNTLLLELMWMSESMSMQHFKYIELGDPRIITEHKFQPLSVERVDKAPTENCRQILVHDIFARFYGAQVGHVLKCQGIHRQSGEQTDYLQVYFFSFTCTLQLILCFRYLIFITLKEIS
jgi:hypothetical protein